MGAANARQSLAAARRHLRDARPEFADRARAWHALAEAIYGDLLTASELTAPATTAPRMVRAGSRPGLPARPRPMVTWAAMRLPPPGRPLIPPSQSTPPA